MKIVWHKLLRSEKGQALPIVLALLLLGGLFTASLLGYMGTGLKTVQVFEDKMGGLYAADAGVEDALWKVMNDPPAVYPYSYSLPDVNGMSVNITIEEVTTIFGEEVGDGGTHESWLTLESELVQPVYYDGVLDDYIHEWRLKLTNKVNPSVDINSITVSYSNALEYLSGLYDEDVAGLALGSFESFTTDFIYLSNVTILTWEFPPPRPKIDGAPDPDNEVYTMVTITFELKGPQEAAGISSYLVAARQDVGTVWEFKPFGIMAQAYDGSTLVTTVTARTLATASTATVTSWQIQ